MKFLGALEEGVYRAWERVDGTEDPRDYAQPHITVQITPDGLAMLQQALAERMALGLVKPPAPRVA